MRTLATYATAGMCQAVLATIFWIENSRQPAHKLLVLTLLLIHAWPVILTHLILLGRDTRTRALATAGYFAALTAIALGSGLQPR